jgi:CubicO group peptidase (beta-lactamase class C family)
MQMRSLIVSIIATAFLVLVVGYISSVGRAADELPPYWPTAGWQTSTPEEQGMDSETIAAMIEYLRGYDGSQVDSLMIIRNGYLIAEVYFYPFTKGSKHDIASVTKSFTSTLTGIAIDKGYISNVGKYVLDFFPDRTIANLDAKKRAMTLEHLLTMQTGFECIAEPAEVTLMEMVNSPDWVQFTLDLPMSEAPGKSWVYCGSGAHLLSAILWQATNMSTLEFAQEHLFKPLGISEVIWPTDPQGINRGYGDLCITTDDMAKLGYLYLYQGKWEGRQVLSDTWIGSATRMHVKVSEEAGHGYMVWFVRDDYGFYGAHGRGGQAIFIMPDEHLVMVLTGSGSDPPTTKGLIPNYILPAIKSAEPLPENPEGIARIQSLIQLVAQPPIEYPQPVPELPAIAEQVSGKTYVLEDNQLGLRSISLVLKEEDEAVLQITTDWTIAGDAEVEWLIGLDGIQRISPGRYGMPAAGKGGWDADNNFAAEIDEIGNILIWQATLRFENNRVTVTLVESNGLYPESIIQGELANDM